MTPIPSLLPSDPWWRRDSLLVACSGGLDSTVLLDLLVEHRRRHGWPARLAAACFDHGWRGAEGAADAALVAELCARRGVALFRGRTPASDARRARRTSPEAAARRARYRFLAETARREGFVAAATAHHAGDQAETVLLRLVRGGRLEGLAGIHPAAVVAGVEVVRPLLGVPPEALLEHAERRGLPFREDATNLDLRLTRNRLRSDAARRISPEELARLARVHGLRRRLVEAAAERALGGARLDAGGALDVGRLRRMPSPLRRELLRRAIGAATPRHVALPERALDAVERLLASPRGGAVDLPRARAEVSCGALRVVTQAGVAPASRRAELAGLNASFDAATVVEPLEVRAWRPGDRLDLGPPQAGRKKVKDVFREARVPAWERAGWPLVADALGVLWVPGLRRGARALPRPGRPVRVVTLPEAPASGTVPVARAPNDRPALSAVDGGEPARA